MSLSYEGPQVVIIAKTMMFEQASRLATDGRWRADPWSGSAELLAEFAGRNCYQSWPNKAGRSNRDYLQQQIIEKKHGSVLEHASVTFHIRGVSRSLLAELSRHRHLSFSVLSQRYVDEANSPAIGPPDFQTLNDPEINEMLAAQEASQRRAYERLVARAVSLGMGRKSARGASRSVLGNFWETQIVVTGNHRAWREVLLQRLAPGADTEIRNLSGELLRQLSGVAPALYEDIMKEYGQ